MRSASARTTPGSGRLARWRVWLFDRLEPLSPAPLQTWRSGDLARSGRCRRRRTAGPLSARPRARSWWRWSSPHERSASRGCWCPGRRSCSGSPWASPSSGRRRSRGRARRATRTERSAGPWPPTWSTWSRGHRSCSRSGGPRPISTGSTHRPAGWPASPAGGPGPTGAVSALVALCTGGAVTGVLALAVAARRAGTASSRSCWPSCPLTALGSFEVIPPLAAAARGLAEVAAAGRRLLALADRPPAVTDPDRAGAAAHRPGRDRRCSEARLRYGAELPWALDGVSLTLSPGSTTALVGPSGAGQEQRRQRAASLLAARGGERHRGRGGARADDPARRAGPASRRWTRTRASFAGTIRRERRLRAARRVAARRAWRGSSARPSSTSGCRASRPASIPRSASGGRCCRGASASGSHWPGRSLAGRPVLLLDEPSAGLDEAMADRLLDDVLGASGQAAPFWSSPIVPARSIGSTGSSRSRAGASSAGDPVRPRRGEAPQRTGGTGWAL